MKSRTLAFLATALASALIGGLIVMFVDPARASSRKISRAEQFELIDSQGKLRGVFSASGPDESSTLLRLYGTDRSSLMLLVSPDNEGGSQISFYDAQGQRVLNLQESRPLSQTRRPTSREWIIEVTHIEPYAMLKVIVTTDRIAPVSSRGSRTTLPIEWRSPSQISFE